MECKNNCKILLVAGELSLTQLPNIIILFKCKIKGQRMVWMKCPSCEQLYVDKGFPRHWDIMLPTQEEMTEFLIIKLGGKDKYELQV